ncbi:hypothetical protein ACFY2K_42615 [Kitasatospora sp. NPDC001309]|uniref:hypothetical protein n=1 Tax=Kitasatospora sp. NPDC001309 TaxID=3364013 RepID=UPI0036901E78
MFKAGDQVEVLASEADPWAVGKVGKILDDLAPGQLAPSDLTGGRWTVRIPGFLSGGSALCYSYELRKVA